jgi:hypothetical protein
VDPAATEPEAGLEPEALPEGEAFFKALAEPQKREDIVQESHLIDLINKVMRKDRSAQFRTEPQAPETKLSYKLVRSAFARMCPLQPIKCIDYVHLGLHLHA